MPQVFTIGHSTRTLGELLALLQSYAIQRLVDVRRFPGSRRHPHFSQYALAQALRSVDIAYEHQEALGGRRSATATSANIGWRNRAFRGYADYMATADFRTALDHLIDVAAKQRTAVMCAEAVPWRCHRNLIADALVVSGLDVLHILEPDRADRHTLHPMAQILPNGGLVYPATGEQLGLIE